MERRTFLRGAVIGSSAAAFGGTLMHGAAYAAPAQPGAGPYGALGAAAANANANANANMLPAGFSSRVIARSSQTVRAPRTPGTPDGGAGLRVELGDQPFLFTVQD